MQRYLPSEAPVDIVGTIGIPGHMVAKVRSSAVVTSGSSGEGGTATMGMSFPSAVFSGTTVILTLGSAATRSNVLRTLSGSSPGKMRQFTLARAVCGSALGAWPPDSIVATHVVCSNEL